MAANPHRVVKQVSDIEVREFRNWAELESLRSHWDRIAGANPSLGLFSTPEWLLPWWKAYGGGREPLTLVFSDEGAIVGIVPFYVESARTMFGSVRKLLLIGDGSQDSDDLDFIVAPGYEDAVAAALFQWAASSNSWDVCELNCMSTRSAVLPLLQQHAHAAKWVTMEGQRPTSVISLPNSWELYLKRLSSKERRKIGQRYRHCENNYQMRIYRCESLEQLPQCLETLFRIHNMRWQTRGEPGTFALPERRKFYHEMSAELLRRGWLEFWFLELNGTTVSAHFAMRYGNSLLALQEGFDPSWTKARPGYVLRSRVIQYCTENGITTYDFLAGDQEVKRKWGAQLGRYVDFSFARPRTRGAAVLATAKKIRAGKDWLKKNLPLNVVQKIQKFRASRGQSEADNADNERDE